MLHMRFCWVLSMLRQLLRFAVVAVTLTARPCAADGQVDCESVCRGVYPSIVGIFPAPVTFFSDSTIGPQHGCPTIYGGI
jgi:hypothetical protein